MPDDIRSLYTTIGRDLTSHGVMNLDGVFESVADTAFIDWMHTSESGNRLVGRALSGRLAPEITPPQGQPAPAR